VPIAVSAMLALNVDATTVTESEPVALSAARALNMEAATLTESSPATLSEMLVLKIGAATNVSDRLAFSLIETLNVFAPVDAKGAVAKGEPLNICYPIRQRQG